MAEEALRVLRGGHAVGRLGRADGPQVDAAIEGRRRERGAGLRQHAAWRMQHPRKGKNLFFLDFPFIFHSFYIFCTSSFLKVAEIKDNQIRGTLKNLETSIHHWDSDKCPAVK